KRVVRLAPVRNVRIELPDGKFHDFGENFVNRMETELHASGRYIVETPQVGIPDFGVSSTARESPPNPEWIGSMVPAATLIFEVETLSFQTGSRGDRMFY